MFDVKNVLSGSSTCYSRELFDKYGGFEEIIDDVYDKVIGQSGDSLKGNKRLVRTLLHYMYCKCDIGKRA